MYISQARKTELYAAISGPIMDTRIIISRSDSSSRPLSLKEVDELLFKLEREVWINVCKSLNVQFD